MTQLKKSDLLELKRSIYREYSRSYDEDRDRFVSGTALAQRIDWALEPLLTGGNLLDLGCGSGQLLRRAEERTDGSSLLAGLDLTPDMLSLAKAELGDSVLLVEGNAAAGLPFKEASFDVVSSLNLIQELPPDAVPALFASVRRVLRPGGFFRAVIPCMADNDQASELFRRMARIRCAMEFGYSRDLESLLLGLPGFVGTRADFLPSPAAANAAKGGSRFTLFTEILDDIESLGIDPGRVQQGVIFFTGQRGPGN